MNRKEFVATSKELWESKAFKDYAKAYPEAYAQAVAATQRRTNAEPGTLGFLDLFWHLMWVTLPDNPKIRRDPFFTICDLAEFICFGAE